MNLLENLRIALRGLASNKMRTALTMLGIIIGVGVVIIVVAIGQGASQSVTAAINSLGTNQLSIRPNWGRVRLTAAVAHKTRGSGPVASSTVSANFGGSSDGSDNLTLDDANRIAANFPQTVAAVAPQVRGGVQARLGATDSSTSYVGTTPAYIYVNNITLSSGRFFTSYDVDGRRLVCVVGKTVADNLVTGGSHDLTGRTISVSGKNFEVIGMLTPKGAGAFGQDQDDVVVMPITTAMMRIDNKTRLDFMSIRCTTEKMMPLAQQQIASFLRNRHHLRPPFPDNDDFRISSQTELMARQQSVTGTMTSLLSAVAIISLIVGGIGIMNIMLVSVTERTREIGIRKAIGATPRDILLQFLIESAIISLLGGLVGIIIGIGGAVLLATVGGWNTIIGTASVFIALGVSAGVGLFFGIYPATKAAALHPIEALRYE